MPLPFVRGDRVKLAHLDSLWIFGWRQKMLDEEQAGGAAQLGAGGRAGRAGRAACRQAISLVSFKIHVYTI